MSTTLLDAALAYAAKGWPVLPLLPGGKRPLASLVPHGLSDASTDPERIRKWWAKWPAANVGVRCDHLAVVDIDPRNGGEVPDGLPETRTHLTGGQGLHLLYASEGGSKGKLGQGVDLQRGPGAYIVAPPSVTDAPYEVIDDRELAPWVELAPANGAAPAPERTDPTPIDRLRAELLIEAGSEKLPEKRRAQLRAIALGESFAEAGERDHEMTSVTAALAARFPTESLETLVELMSPSLKVWDPFKLPAERAKAYDKLASARRKFPPSEELLAGADFDWAPRALAKPPADAPKRASSDDGNALLLIDVFGEDLRYCVSQKRWYQWGGLRWVGGAMADMAVLEAARRLGREILPEGVWAKKSQDASRISAAASLARSDGRVRVEFEAFDADPWLLCVSNGTLDLHSGALREHGRGDYITKLAPVTFDPAVAAPGWIAFLERVLPDAEVRAYLQRFVGYCLTGSTVEQCVLFMIGEGSNGKSVFLDVLTAMLGDYATVVPAETLASARSSARAKGGASPDLARLAGVRLAVAKETEGGAELAEAMLKDVTGGELVTARELYSGFVNFRPMAKIVLGTNYPPTIRGADRGIWRRLRRIDFEVVIPDAERDRQLGERLRTTELSGVLNWALEGLRAYLDGGLREPPQVLQAIRDYRATEDRLGSWLEAECEVGDDLVSTFGELHASFQACSQAEGFGQMSKKEFASQLDARGIRGKASWPGFRGAVRVGARLRARGPFGGGRK